MFRRIIAAVLLLIVAAGLLMLAWPQLFGAQKAPIIAQVVSLRGLAIGIAAVGIVALLILGLLSRPFRRLGTSLAVLLLAFGLVSTAVLASRGFGDTAFQAKGASDITVLSWNTLGGAPGYQTIAKVALGADADIVTLPETKEETADLVAQAMTQAGHPMSVHTTAFDHISPARSTSVLISHDLGAYTVDTSVGSTSTLPTLVLHPDDGSGPTIVAVHAVSPIPDELGNWRSDLAWLGRNACAGANVIMAGDFNSTLDHFAGLGAASGDTIGNCTDAGQRSGNAAVGTWPTALPTVLGAPIDHVMTTSGWAVTGMRVIEDEDTAGSDHRPIVVQLHPQG